MSTDLITEHLDLWTSAVTYNNGKGRGNNGEPELTGIQKLRELILELAVRGKLVPQDPEEEPASKLLERIEEEKKRLYKEGKIKKPKKLPVIAEDEKPFKLPMGWAWSRLDHLAPIPLFDGDWVESKDQDESGKIRLLQLADIGINAFKNVSKRYINQETFERLNCSELNSGDILIARLPSPVGRTAILPELGQKCITAVDVAVLRPNDELDSQFVSAAINSKTCREQIESYGKGTTRFRIATGKLKTILIPVPPLNEQNRIIEKFNELMALCDRLEMQTSDQLSAHETLVDTLLDTLTCSQDAAELADNWARLAEHFDTLFTTEHSIDRLEQTILQLAVMGRLVPQDPNDEPASKLLEHVEQEKGQLIKEGKQKKLKPLPPFAADEVPFEVPVGWKWERFDTILVDGPTNGWSPKTVEYDTGLRTLTLSATTKGRFNGSHSKFVEADLNSDSPLWLFPGDVLIQRSNTPEYVGIAAVYDGPERGFIYPDLMMRCRISQNFSTEFFQIVWNAPFNRSQLSQQASGTSRSMVKINQSMVRSIIIPIPPRAEQERIAESFKKLKTICDDLKTRLKQARESQTSLSDSLVKRAVNGDADSVGSRHSFPA